MIFNSTAHTYLSSLMRFFVRKGKKQKIQSKIYTFIRIKNKDQKSKLRRMLKTCCIKTSTYLRLIQRRRGRRIQYKIKFLKRSFGRKRGLLLVGKSMYWHTKKSPRQFTFLFNQELNNWAHGKHSLKQKYKETHIIAKRYAPRSWFWKVKKWEK